MTYNDKFGTDNGLFATIFKPNFPELYTDIFGDTQVELIDAYTLVKYGGRTLIEPIRTDLVAGYIESVITINSENWKAVADALKLNYDLLKPIDITETRTIDIVAGNDEDNKLTNSNIPYNESEQIEYEKTSDNRTAQRTEQHTITDNKSGRGGNTSNYKIIQEEIKKRQLNVQKTVISTILQSITLSVIN